MRRLLALSFALLLATHSASADDLVARALEILRQVPVIDGHNDTPYQFTERKKAFDEIDLRDTSALQPAMHTDLRWLRAGGLGGQFWSIYVSQRDYPGDRAVLKKIAGLNILRAMRQAEAVAKRLQKERLRSEARVEGAGGV